MKIRRSRKLYPDLYSHDAYFSEFMFLHKFHSFIFLKLNDEYLSTYVDQLIMYFVISYFTSV